MELEKYVAWHVKYHIILGHLMEYEYQGIYPGSNVWYLLNGIRCDKLSTAVATVRAHSYKNKKNFDAVVASPTQYIDKRAPKQSVNVTSAGQTKPAKGHKTSINHDTLKGKNELKKLSGE